MLASSRDARRTRRALGYICRASTQLLRQMSRRGRRSNSMLPPLVRKIRKSNRLRLAFLMRDEYEDAVERV